VVGQVGKGYSPIVAVGMCVTNALECMDSTAMRAAALRSIIFPLIGTGAAGGKRRDNAQELIDAAVTYLRAHPNSRVETVYFLAWTQGDLDTWQRTLRDTPGVEFAPDSKNGKRPSARRTAAGSRRTARR
jgi:O-acetyl-ADP-ribose deacetylase (regulator of RNase III)